MAMRFLLRLLFVAVITMALLLPLALDCPADNPPQAKDVLRKRIQAHPDSALLHAQLASIYFKEGTVRGRALATKHLKRALRIDPRSSDYRLMLAEIYFEGTFWSYGVNQLKSILEADGSNSTARYRLGKAYLDRAIEEWQKDWFSRAEAELRSVDRAGPVHRDASKHLALCYFDLGLADSSISLLGSLPEDSLDEESLLIMGMALCQKKSMDDSHLAFSKALEAMGRERRRRYISLEPIASADEVKRLAATQPQDMDQVVEALWRSRDPNPATQVNERLVEHLARVAFADLHFSVPRLDKPGCETTRGEVYIRYGRPLKWFFDPFGTNTFVGETVLPPSERIGLDPDAKTRWFEELGSRYRTRPLRVDKPRWVWQYRDFTLSFEDVVLNGDYTFPYERDWSAVTYAYLEKKIPEIYQSQIRKRMRVVIDALNLMTEEGRPCLKITYGCDTRGISYEPHFEWPEGDFEIEIAVLDSAYNDIDRLAFITTLRADSSALYQTRYPLIGAWIADSAPGHILVAISVRSKENQSAGFAHTEMVGRMFGEHLTMSDLELRFDRDGPPNPSHVYLRRGKVYIGFNIYNISTVAGMGELEVGYRLVRKGKPTPLFDRFINLFSTAGDIAPAGRVTSLWSKYRLRSKGETAHEVIGIDLSPLLSGDYDIEITVSDKIAGLSAQAVTAITVASESGL